MSRRLVLLRHGESEWNRDQRFTGWADVGLTELGTAQMREAGQVLRQAEIRIDVAFTSVLKRAIQSMWQVLDSMDCCWLPIQLDWRLNERHYGALTGLSKSSAVDHFGIDAVQAWRRGYDACPPEVDARAARHIPIDRRYAAIPTECIPRAESLQRTASRVREIWEVVITPLLQAGETALVLSHGNTLRALIGLLEQLSPQELVDLNVPNGVPMIYELDEQWKVLRRRELLVSKATRSAVL